MSVRETHRWLYWLLWGTLVALIASFSVRDVVSWQNYGDLDSTCGAWTAAAIDLADDGTLYRPLISEIGIGGCRYAPLHIVLHAGRAGLPPVASGYGISFVGIILVGCGIYRLLVQLGADVYLAALMAASAIAAACFQFCAERIGSDPIALAFDIWGLSAVLAMTASDRRTGWGLPILAAVCFALSASAKITSGFGLCAGLVYLVLNRRYSLAFRVGLVWLVAIALVVVSVLLYTKGNAYWIFRQTAMGGGGLADLMRAPLMFAQVMLRDKVTLLFWGICLVLVFMDRGEWTLPRLLFVVTTAGTILIFGSPGTSLNHLLSLQAACIILVGAWLARHPTNLVIPVCILICMVYGLRHVWVGVAATRQEAQRTILGQIVAEIRESHVAGPIYANSPLIPILAGQRPYILDPFMARLVRIRNPRIAQTMWDQMARQRFSACVVNIHPSDWGPEWAADDQLVKDHLYRYELKSVRERYCVYLPKMGNDAMTAARSDPTHKAGDR